jgi:hypothetical protein
VTDADSACAVTTRTDDGFRMGFCAHVQWVRLDTRMLRPLVQQARALFDTQAVPQGMPWCKNCPKLDELLQLLA